MRWRHVGGRDAGGLMAKEAEAVAFPEHVAGE